jgi:hypothetical protein
MSSEIPAYLQAARDKFIEVIGGPPESFSEGFLRHLDAAVNEGVHEAIKEAINKWGADHGWDAPEDAVYDEDPITYDARSPISHE